MYRHVAHIDDCASNHDRDIYKTEAGALAAIAMGYVIIREKEKKKERLVG